MGKLIMMSTNMNFFSCLQNLKEKEKKNQPTNVDSALESSIFFLCRQDAGHESPIL